MTLLGITPPALTCAPSIDWVMNGIAHPFFGFVSDHLGRENIMGAAFLLKGGGLLLLLRHAGNPTLFAVLTGLVFFAWGETYSLCPAACADLYGRKHVTTIDGMLYTAKGTAALLVPVSSFLSRSSGWSAAFYVASALNCAAALAAWLVLTPACARAHLALGPDRRATEKI